VTLPREMRRACRIAGFGAITAAMLPAFLARRRTVRPEAREELRDRWMGAWCASLLGMFGVHVLSNSLPVLGRDRGHLIVANHRSTADILILLRTFGGQMVSRADLARWPLVGPGARAVGTVFVDRSDAVSGASAVRTIRTLLTKGSKVIVFPEGTTFVGDEVRSFHAGAFVAALGSGADIVPVGLAYETGSGAAFVNESFRAHLARMAAAAASRVAVCACEPIEIGEKARAADLRDRAHARVQELVAEARRLVDGETSDAASTG
jgi:lyso-ornithine lipid O-acyltransferase